MKQFLLVSACLLFAAFSSKAQGVQITINNNTTYNLYMTLSASSTCSGTDRAAVVIPPGTTIYTDPTAVPIPNTTSTDEFYHVRMYNYDPNSTCYTQQSINLSGCMAGVPMNDNIVIYDMCTGGTPLPVNVDWDNGNTPTSVILNIN